MSRVVGHLSHLDRVRVKARLGRKVSRSRAWQWIGNDRDRAQEGIFLSKLRRPHGSEEQSFRALAQMERLKERKGRY
jgi:hypothetical protein